MGAGELSSFSALLLGLLCLSAAVALSWALGKLKAPIGEAKPKTVTVDLLMSGPVASYSYPPKRTDEVSVAHDDQTGNSEVDIRIQLARQETKVEGLTQTVER